MKNRIAMLLIIVIVISFFGTACGKQTEHVYIPVPDESQVEIDPVTLEQIEERAKELEKKYCEPIYAWTYEDIYKLLVMANYEYLSKAEKSKCLDNQMADKSICFDYVSDVGAKWEYVYGVNSRGGGDHYYNCPRLAELFFDDDLVAQAEFMDRQLYNFAYQQDEHAMYNITTYIWSEDHSMTTEYAPYHYEGEVMTSGAGYLINSVAVDVFNYVIQRYGDMSGYSLANYEKCPKPNVSLFYSIED